MTDIEGSDGYLLRKTKTGKPPLKNRFIYRLLTNSGYDVSTIPK